MRARIEAGTASGAEVMRALDEAAASGARAVTLVGAGARRELLAWAAQAAARGMAIEIQGEPPSPSLRPALLRLGVRRLSAARPIADGPAWRAAGVEVIAPRGNSFSYLPVGVAGAAPLPADPRDCPLYAAPPPPPRRIALAAAGQLTVCATDSADFSDGEIDAALAGGQLYRERGDKPAPDDFAADLEPLAPSAPCRACDRARDGRCGGAWELLDDPAADRFATVEKPLREAIAEVAGRGGAVLDVGCGDGRYGELWAPAARAGRLRYLGVEPDGERAHALASAWPWAEVIARPIEELGDGDLPPQLDALLALRSWNHLADPAAALAPLVERLAPGAPLLVADDVPFALVRSAERQARADRGSPIDHLRSDGDREALALLAGLPLELSARHAAPAGATLWTLILYRR